MNLASSLDDCDDRVLIRMILAGRNDCFSLLMDRHVVAVKRQIRSMVSNQDDLEDILQEVLLKVWRHLGQFRAESSLRTWMIRVAINQANQSYRRRKWTPPSQPLEDCPEIAATEEFPDQRMVRKETSQAVRGAVARLPHKYRQVVMLRDLSELGVGETARRLRISESAIKTRLYRARLMLSSRLRTMNLKVA